MLLLTTPTVEGRSVRRYLGVIGSEVILGANALRDVYALFTDVFGGRSGRLEEVFDKARKEALDSLAGKARKLGADAVLNLRFNYLVLGKDNGMMMVAVTGTAARMADSDDDRILNEGKTDLGAAQPDEPTYFVEIDSRRRGPFSLAQIRELRDEGRIKNEAEVQSEADGKLTTVSAVLG